MKILVVACNRSHAPFPVIPAGASMVARALADRGVAVTFLDLCFVDDPEGAVARALADRPDGVAVSFRNLDNLDLADPVSYIPLLTRIADMTHAAGLPLYLGGSAVAVAPDELAKATGARTVFVGSAAAFARRLVAGDLPAGKVVDWSDETHVPFGVETYPDLTRYLAAEKMIPVRLKLGCPFKCSYCTYPAIEEPGLPCSSGDQMEAFIRPWLAKGVGIDLVDAIFNEPEEWAIATLDDLADRGLFGNYHISAVLPKVTDTRLFSAMTRLGANNGMIGVDAGCDAMLASYNKPFRMRHVERFNELRKGFDLSFIWTFIIGGFGETEGTLAETMRFVESLPESDVVYLTLGLRLYPRTKLFDQARATGAITPQQDGMWPTFYFSPSLDREKTARMLEEWSDATPHVAFSTLFDSPEYQATLQRLAHLDAPSPGWKLIPTVKKLMLRERGRGKRSA
ncbi:MAG: cobalamin-dependent protein [Nitrospinae bacterium]|nr:cobalamin-dependent protein [Nitrospinota bacterium]